MPQVLAGNFDGETIHTKDLGYEYPDGLDLRPDSELHKKLVKEIKKRADASHRVMSRRYPSWREVDKVLTAYIYTDEKEKEVKQKDPRKPVSIVFPHSYAIMEIMLSYLVMAFLQEPYFRYEATSPEDTVGTTLLESVINLQCLRLKVGLALHTMFRDAFGYGIAPITPTWNVIRGKRIVQDSDIFWSEFSRRFVKQAKGRRLEDAVLFEGNSLHNIDPYRWFPDPTVSAHEPQKGEFCGWLTESSYHTMLREELEGGGDVFNVKYLKGHKGKKSKYADDESAREEKHGGVPEKAEEANKIYKLYMFWDLIPKDLKLSTNEYPERWMFCLSQDSVITEARPLAEAHGQYPVAVSAPDFDGYSPTPIARLEILGGPQGLLDWLLNAHITNVRKAINDMLVVDPYIINVPDLKKQGPGKLIRVRRPGWGKPELALKAVHQLKVDDVTRQNVGDALMVAQMMNMAAGTDESMGGLLRQRGPERLTKSEFQGTRAGAIGRMERVAKIIGIQVFQDIGYQFAHNTQQYMNEDVYAKAIGAWPERVMGELGIGPTDGYKVTPYDLLVDYDVLVRDGSIPGGNWNESWVQLFQIIASQPALLTRFDIVRIFKFMARNLGAKNVDEFEIKTSSNEDTIRLLEQGNIAPIGGAGV